MKKRKYPLLRNEIEMIQLVLREDGYPSREYMETLVERLEDLKKLWYKVKQLKNETRK